MRFSGNESISKTTLRTIIKTRTNREFLNIPNFTPWYWLWNLTGSLGDSPYILDRAIVGNDIERLEAYYESQGFLDAKIDTSIIAFGDRNVEISFLISEGKPSYLKQLVYTGMPEFLSEREKKRFYDNSNLFQKRINDTTFVSNDRFLFEKISLERERIIEYLKNNGYASVQRDSITFYIKRDSLNRQKLDVLIKVRSGSIYTFGDTKIILEDADNSGKIDRFDMLRVDAQSGLNRNIIIHKSSKAATSNAILIEQLAFKSGDKFKNSSYMRTVRNFQNLGIANVRRYSLSKDGSLPDFSNTLLPVYFNLQAIPKHSVNLNIFGFQRYGYGTGLGVTYVNRNLFNNAERLEIGVNGSIEYANLNNQTALLNRDITIGYSVPKLHFPLQTLNTKQLFENSRTLYQIRFSQINQINFNVNANIGFNLRYESNHTQFISSSLDLIDIEWLDVVPDISFRNAILNDPNLTPIQKSFILDDFKPQINSVLRYTLRSIDTDVIKHNRGYFFETSLEFGGNLPYLVDKYLNSPSSVDGFISFIDDAKLAYDQFIKLSVDYRRYISLSNQFVVAYRSFAGYAIPYGQSQGIPITRRFYAGGSNDIRGWAPGVIGPGSTPPLATISSSFSNGGEIKLALFAEARQELVKKFLSTRWLFAVFTDAGNIWNGPQSQIPEGEFRFNRFYKEFAVSSGFGLRLDWDYIILRIDASYRLHDPAQNLWFNNTNTYWTFGIGQSF